MGKAPLLKRNYVRSRCKRAVDVGATAIAVSNHGGRQLDGSRAPFDQLAEIVDAVGDKVDVICDGGIRRGTHVLKALSLGRRLVQEVECIYTRWPLQVRRVCLERWA